MYLHLKLVLTSWTHPLPGRINSERRVKRAPSGLRLELVCVFQNPDATFIFMLRIQAYQLCADTWPIRAKNLWALTNTFTYTQKIILCSLFTP